MKKVIDSQFIILGIVNSVCTGFFQYLLRVLSNPMVSQIAWLLLTILIGQHLAESSLTDVEKINWN